MPPRLRVPHKDEHSPYYREDMIAVERWANAPLIQYKPTTNTTVGNGTLVGWFQIRGNWCDYSIQYNLNTTTAFPAANILLGLPLARANLLDAIGWVFAQAGAGPGSFVGTAIGSGADNKSILIESTQFWTNLFPANWVAATNNLIRVTGSYMAQVL